MDQPKEIGITINGIVAHRNYEPYVQILKNNDVVCQCSMAEARNVAMDILQMCARTEADAVIHQFFRQNGFPDQASAQVMLDFRVFRHKLDTEPVEKSMSDPDTGARV